MDSKILDFLLTLTVGSAMIGILIIIWIFIISMIAMFF